MNYIKLFLASSTVEFHEERLELEAYIDSLNKIYVRRGVFFDLTICEDLSNAMAKERKQAEYNEFIRDSQYFYILFGTTVGDYTIEEFDVALEAFRESGAPKIYTYFLQLPETQPPQQSVRDFMERVDKELGHFYSTFTHIDSIKLNLLMELCRDPLAGGRVKLEDGRATLDGQPVLSMENIPLYSKNEAVQNLLAEKRKLDAEFADLAALGDSEVVKRLRMANSERRNKIAEQLHALEMDVLGLYTEISEKRQLGRQLNWREKKAIEYVDAGNYDAAKKVLRDKLWSEEVKQAEELIDGAKEHIREKISEKRMLIHILKASGVTEESEQEILSVYEEISKLAEKHQIELDVLYDYASFLKDQNRYPEGILVAERLRNLYGLVEGVAENKTTKLLNLLGLLYSDNHVFQKAEILYQEALEICRRLAKDNPAAYEPDVAIICNNLANLLSDISRYDEAEKLYREALEIRRRLVQDNPAAYEPDAAVICNNLANLLDDTNRHNEAEKLYREALGQHRIMIAARPKI